MVLITLCPRQRGECLWRGTVVIVFSLTALLKIADVLSNGHLWHFPDPVFSALSRAEAALVAVILEAACAVAVLSRLKTKVKWLSVFCTTSCLLAYRSSMYVVGASVPCNCLGKLPQLVGLTFRQTESIAWLILVTFFVVSLYYLFILA